MDFRRIVRFACGFAAAFLLVLLPAELFLRFFPPPDVQPFLGEDSTIAGHWRPHRTYGVTYRDDDAFRQDYQQRLSEYPPSLLKSNPVWALFGNSFVHMPGMLADTLRSDISDRVIFNLGRNEPLNVRLAQIELLLEGGFRPEQLIVELMPTDVCGLGEQPLETIQVNQRGGMVYRPRLPAGIPETVFTSSRLALTGWLRTGWHVGNPAFNRHKVYDGLDPQLLADLRTIFTGLADVTSRHGVPTTILLIPAYHQIARGASFGFQAALTPMFAELGLDVLDPREAFLAERNPESFFLPDRHFNEAGNEILEKSLLTHIGYGTPTPLAGKERPRQ